jgi:hypothetical protein
LTAFGACSQPPQAGQDSATPAPPVTAKELLTRLETQRAAGQADEALKTAQELVNSHKGTPEAKSAATAVPDLEIAATRSHKEAEKRAAEAEAAETARQLAAKWSYDTSEDTMTSKIKRKASIESENTVSFAFPYRGEQHGTLILRDHPTHGRDVMFSIEKGQLLCRSYEDCQIRVRFDGGSPQRWSAIGPSDNSTTLIFLRNQARFVQLLRKSKVVLLQVPVYQQGDPIFEFEVGGFDWSRYQGK